MPTNSRKWKALRPWWTRLFLAAAAALGMALPSFASASPAAADLVSVPVQIPVPSPVGQVIGQATGTANNASGSRTSSTSSGAPSQGASANSAHAGASPNGGDAHVCNASANGPASMQPSDANVGSGDACSGPSSNSSATTTAGSSSASHDQSGDRGQVCGAMVGSQFVGMTAGDTVLAIGPQPPGCGPSGKGSSWDVAANNSGNKAGSGNNTANVGRSSAGGTASGGGGQGTVCGSTVNGQPVGLTQGNTAVAVGTSAEGCPTRPSAAGGAKPAGTGGSGSGGSGNNPGATGTGPSGTGPGGTGNNPGSSVNGAPVPGTITAPGTTGPAGTIGAQPQPGGATGSRDTTSGQAGLCDQQRTASLVASLGLNRGVGSGLLTALGGLLLIGIGMIMGGRIRREPTD